MTIRRVTLFILVLMATACSAIDIPSEPQSVTSFPVSQDTPEPTTTQNVQVVTLAPDDFELPPTWTPTFTPTITETPIPTSTSLPTSTSTPIDESIFCAGFTFIFDTSEGQVYSDGDMIDVTLSMQHPEKFLIFGIIDAETEEPIIVRISQQDQAKWVISPAELPANGEYLWAASVSMPSQGGLCEQTGTIIIEADANIPPPSVTGILGDLRQALRDYGESLNNSP